MVSFSIEEKIGRFIKPCPGTPKHTCCGYWIIDFAHGCPLECSYCILNHYFGRGNITLYRNTDRIYEEIEEFLKARVGITRFGTGEFTDSLVFENEHPLYHELVPFIAKRRDAILEIKTKTTSIEQLLKIKERDNVIVSWSLNSEKIARSEEKRAPGIKSRISAAQRAQDGGYNLAFHFDPIIIYKGWEDDYRKTVDLLFEKIDPEQVVYISMGTLRFPPEMMRNMSAEIRAGEFIQGMDKKLRYFRPLRTGAYRKIKEYLMPYVSEDILYLCMESQVVWEDVFNIKMDSEGLKRRLDKACFDKFKLLK
jgi:spore photoproduct lyase